MYIQMRLPQRSVFGRGHKLIGEVVSLTCKIAGHDPSKCGYEMVKDAVETGRIVGVNELFWFHLRDEAVLKKVMREAIRLLPREAKWFGKKTKAQRFWSGLASHDFFRAVVEILERVYEETERSKLVRQLFATPDQQINHLRGWAAKSVGGFDRLDLDTIPLAPRWPAGDGSVLVLTPYLGTPGLTLYELMHMAVSPFVGKVRRLPMVAPQIVHHSDHHGPELRWERVNLSEQVRPTEAFIERCGSTGPQRPGAAVVALAAYSPRWLKTVSIKESAVTIPGFRVGSDILTMAFDDECERIEFNPVPATNRPLSSRHYVLPTYVAP